MEVGALRIDDLPECFFYIESDIYEDLLGNTMTAGDILNNRQDDSDYTGLSNIRASMVFYALTLHVKDLYPDAEVSDHVNCVDTSFYIDGNRITSKDDWECALEKLENPISEDEDCE